MKKSYLWFLGIFVLVQVILVSFSPVKRFLEITIPSPSIIGNLGGFYDILFAFIIFFFASSVVAMFIKKGIFKSAIAGALSYIIPAAISLIIALIFRKEVGLGIIFLPLLFVGFFVGTLILALIAKKILVKNTVEEDIGWKKIIIFGLVSGIVLTLAVFSSILFSVYG